MRAENPFIETLVFEFIVGFTESCAARLYDGVSQAFLFMKRVAIYV